MTAESHFEWKPSISAEKIKLTASKKQVGQAGIGIVSTNIISAAEDTLLISFSLDALWKLDVHPTVLSSGDGRKSVHSDLQLST